MTGVSREVRGDSLGAFKRFDGSLLCFCHAAMVLVCTGSQAMMP